MSETQITIQTGTLASDYQKYDTVIFQHYRPGGDYEFATRLEGMVTGVTGDTINVAYSEPPRWAEYASIGRVAVINPRMVPMARTARYEG